MTEMFKRLQTLLDRSTRDRWAAMPSWAVIMVFCWGLAHNFFWDDLLGQLTPLVMEGLRTEGLTTTGVAVIVATVIMAFYAVFFKWLMTTAGVSLCHRLPR